MGAWGGLPFENDAALDWLGQLEEGGGAALREALRTAAACPEGDYLDVDDGSAALAAAKVVALAFGKEREHLPDEVTHWLNTEGREITPSDAALAKKAVERVLGSQSELSSLWEGHGPESEWHEQTRALLAFLEAHAGSAQVPAELLGAPREFGEREKQALFAFLQARGLEPTRAQAARIRASRDRAEIVRWISRVVSVTSVESLFDD